MKFQIGDKVQKKSFKPFKSGKKIEIIKQFGTNREDPKTRECAIFEDNSTCNLEILVKL